MAGQTTFQFQYEKYVHTVFSLVAFTASCIVVTAVAVVVAAAVDVCLVYTTYHKCIFKMLNKQQTMLHRLWAWTGGQPTCL